ncbi:MAG: twin-arginine translocation signal domain-containing protein [Nitrososphaeraceae archaeon]
MAPNLKEHKSQDKKLTRRDFLKLAGVAGAVGATLPSLISFGQVLGSVGTNNNTNINQTTTSKSTAMNQQSSSVRIFDLECPECNWKQDYIGCR